MKQDFLDIYLTTFSGVRKLKNISAIKGIFFLEVFKIESKFRKCKRKKSRKISPCWDNCILKCCNKFPLFRREYLPSAVNGLTSSPKILHISQRDLFNPNFLQRSINMVNLLPLRFQQFFGPFTLLPVKGSSETGFFRHLSNHVFHTTSVRKYISYEGHLFFENV